jgi:hypothetical protein
MEMDVAALIVFVVIELKFPCRELVIVVLIRLLRNPADPRPVCEDTRATSRDAELIYPADPRPTILEKSWKA